MHERHTQHFTSGNSTTTDVCAFSLSLSLSLPPSLSRARALFLFLSLSLHLPLPLSLFFGIYTRIYMYTHRGDGTSTHVSAGACTRTKGDGYRSGSWANRQTITSVNMCSSENMCYLRTALSNAVCCSVLQLSSTHCPASHLHNRSTSSCCFAPYVCVCYVCVYACL